MRHHATWTVAILACLGSLVSAGCSGGHDATKTTAGPATCLSAGRPAPSACWELVSPLGTGGFPPERGSFDSPKWTPGRWPLTLEPVVGFNGDLWMMSQTHAWSSRDGLNWTHYPKTDWGERISQAYAFFDGRLWMFGGLRYNDRIPLNDIWSSTDGTRWTNTGNAAWSPRKAQTIIAFRNKLWLFGGADQVKHDFSTVHALDDVWSSDDGLRWTQPTAAAAWSPREGATVIVLKDALYLLGGQGHSDVWRSDDGVNWTQLSPEAEWKPRYGYGTAVFGDKLWVYGGWEGKPTNALNDVWYSTDGKTWVRQAEHAPWAPRSPRTIVYKDKLWIFSGKHTGGKDNWGGDIWTMSLRQ
jgi:hypothetical protein